MELVRPGLSSCSEHVTYSWRNARCKIGSQGANTTSVKTHTWSAANYNLLIAEDADPTRGVSLEKKNILTTMRVANCSILIAEDADPTRGVSREEKHFDN